MTRKAGAGPTSRNSAKADEIVIDVNSCTLGELAKVEKLVGRKCDFLQKGELPDMQQMQAIVTVFQNVRYGHPHFTMEDAENIRLDQVVPPPSKRPGAGEKPPLAAGPHPGSG